MTNRKTIFFLCMMSIILMWSSGPLWARIIHVPGEEPTIRAGIIVASPRDTVMVGPGTYSGVGNYDLQLGGKNIVVRSMKGSSTTVINCGGNETWKRRAFYIHQGEDSTAVIDGFTIINGYAPPAGPDNLQRGGGILCENNSSPTIRDCIFYYNYANKAGGGLCCLSGASPLVENCTFVDNSAYYGSVESLGGYGGAVRCDSSSARFRECVFATNRANLGGAVSCNSSDVTFDRCEFTDNTADVIVTFEPVTAGVGGGLHLNQSTAMITSCIFDGNTAVYGDNMDMAATIGGGIAAFYCNLTLSSCTFFDNTAERYGESIPGEGAGLYLFDTPSLIEKTIVAHNNGGVGISCGYDFCDDTVMIPDLLCCDIFGNEDGDWIGFIADQENVNGNFSKEPYLCNPYSGQFGLWIGSPCLPDSNDCHVIIGARGYGCETDVDEGANLPSHLLTVRNYPNPFNPETIIEYSLPSASPVQIDIYNIVGQVVHRIDEGYRQPGTYTIRWDGRTSDGHHAASGIYLAIVRTERATCTHKMMLMK